MSRLRNLPNAITVARLILVLPIAFFIVEQAYNLALLLFALSGFSDGLDGFLARRFGWASTFGELIDPLADKLMIIATSIALGSLGHFPIMLVVLIVTKDLAILGGVFSYTSLAGFPKIQPNLFGKLTTTVQIILILLVLLNLSYEGLLSNDFLFLWLWVAAVMTLFDGIFYLWLWTARLAEDPRWKETM